ncbi:FprA family A-type flavoprotein [bacterium]|nr:FprA family A-type flavoprotein [bacterium]
MFSKEIRKGIYWVGATDWEIRNFHGYLTQSGTSYNAYLIVDEKIVLVDTVKAELCEQMIERITRIIDPSKIDYILSNHVEMDHSGSIGKVLELAPNAEIVTNPQGVQGLKRHFKKDWKFKVVKSGDSLELGKHQLHFVQTPMVHWPDSMVTYLPGENILFSNDAFGQHIASSERFDSEIGWDIVHQEAKKYYANIVLPFGNQVKKALDSLSSLDIDLICPSHGLIWKDYIPQIISEYCRWSDNEADDRAVIVYDTMWKSTKKMANEFCYGLKEAGIHVVMRDLKSNDISDVMTDVLNSKCIIVGSPTLNNNMLPTVGAFLTYLKGLNPQKRIGVAFGSYGWGGQSIGQIEDVMKELKWELPFEIVKMKYVPDDEELLKIREIGKSLGEKMLEDKRQKEK